MRFYKQLMDSRREPNCIFIFGPEGGLSPAEIESFEAKGAVLAGLGPRILRAETSTVLYALSALSVLLGIREIRGRKWKQKHRSEFPEKELWGFNSPIPRP